MAARKPYQVQKLKPTKRTYACLECGSKTTVFGSEPIPDPECHPGAEVMHWRVRQQNCAAYLKRASEDGTDLEWWIRNEPERRPSYWPGAHPDTLWLLLPLVRKWGWVPNEGKLVQPMKLSEITLYGRRPTQ